MDAKPMDKQAESRLLNAVKEAVAWVGDGVDPTEAVIKVARDLQLNPSMARLLTQAYNTGRTTFQRENHGTSVLDKMAEFPLARLETVLSTLWPEEPELPKQASARVRQDIVPACFLRPPSVIPRDQQQLTEKVAAVKLPVTKPVSAAGDPKIKMAKAYGQAQREAKQVEELRYQAKVAQDRLLSAMSKLADYFVESPLFRESFADVEYNAQLLFGKSAKHVMDYVYLRNNSREKRANGPPAACRRVDASQPPYSLIKTAIDRGAEVVMARHAHLAKTETAQVKIGKLLRPFGQVPETKPVPFSVLGISSHDSSRYIPPSFDKSAGGFFGGALGATIAGSSFRPTQALVQKEQEKLVDPEHLNMLRGIQTQAMLHDFLQNDEVLSSYDPEEVLQAFNEISTLSPSSSTQPAVMRPLLRKRMTQGAYEPFEAEQIAKIEQSIMGSQSNVLRKPSEQKSAEVLHGSPILG